MRIAGAEHLVFIALIDLEMSGRRFVLLPSARTDHDAFLHPVAVLGDVSHDALRGKIHDQLPRAVLFRLVRRRVRGHDADRVGRLFAGRDRAGFIAGEEARFRSARRAVPEERAVRVAADKPFRLRGGKPVSHAHVLRDRKRDKRHGRCGRFRRRLRRGFGRGFFGRFDRRRFGGRRRRLFRPFDLYAFDRCLLRGCKSDRLSRRHGAADQKEDRKTNGKKSLHQFLSKSRFVLRCGSQVRLMPRRR